jgi:Rha family phage regulatory protein
MTAPATNPITAQNIVHLYKGNPVTDSLTIAREFGRPHKNVLQSLDRLIEDGTIGRLEFKPSTYINEQGKPQRMIELPERAALIALPFIGGKKSREGQVRFVDAFLALRDELAAHSSNWADSRQAVSAGFKAVMEALKETRAEVGKETRNHHYTNEARLLNFVLFGDANGVNRSCLSSGDLGVIETIEAKDAYLIARGRSYQERKAALLAFAETVRSKIIKKISTTQEHVTTKIKGNSKCQD